MINLIQLKAFCGVMQDENYSVTRTAERINLDYTAVSRHIISLEEDLGFKLFDRMQYRRRLKPTEEGQKFYDEVVIRYQGLESLLKNYSKEMKEERKNSLKIASVDAILGKIIRHTSEFREKNPHVNITLLNIPRGEAFERLKNDEVDLVFYPSEVEEKCPIELERKEMAQYKSFWVLYKDHPLCLKDEKDITKEDIAKYPFGYLPNPYISHFKKFIEDYNIKTPIDLKNGTTELLKEIIRGKMCISVLDNFYLNKKDEKDFVLKNNVHSFPLIYNYLFYKKNCHMKDITKQFIEILYNNKERAFL